MIPIPRRTISIVDFGPIQNPATNPNRRSRFGYKINLFRYEFDLFRLKDRFKDRKVRLKDQKSQLKVDLYKKTTTKMTKYVRFWPFLIKFNQFLI